MSRNGALTSVLCVLADHKDTENREMAQRSLLCCAFNNVAYQNNARSMQNQDVSNGDHWVLFYSAASLDHSETSVLDSAGLESHRPVNN